MKVKAIFILAVGILAKSMKNNPQLMSIHYESSWNWVGTEEIDL